MAAICNLKFFPCQPLPLVALFPTLFQKAFMAYAIIKTGGKQYKVAKGAKIKVEKLPANAGDTVSFDKVLLIADGNDVKIGAPYIAGAKIPAKLLTQARAKKVA